MFPSAHQKSNFTILKFGFIQKWKDFISIPLKDALSASTVIISTIHEKAVLLEKKKYKKSLQRKWFLTASHYYWENSLIISQLWTRASSLSLYLFMLASFYYVKILIMQLHKNYAIHFFQRKEWKKKKRQKFATSSIQLLISCFRLFIFVSQAELLSSFPSILEQALS